ncbi:MAG: CobD/CbiB family protein [Rhodocyclaceae bacterium]|nr:CobD/CbiB family protein [Rhodocyclaceae bacterium]
MTFFSILCVLVLEQVKALPATRLQALLFAYADWLEEKFNAGERRHGAVAWAVGAGLPAGCMLLLQIGTDLLHPLAGFALDIGVLYLTVGFRQFSHFFTDIHLALRAGEIEQARRLLGEWRGEGVERLSSAEIARLTIETGILSSHRHVFAPLFWFMVAGPAGALLYRLSACLAERWTEAGEVPTERARFGEFSREAFSLVDWLPARLTAITFAIVGDFEDAVFCWRTQAAQWTDTSAGILLSSGAGALGVRLGQPLPGATEIEARPELGLGEEVAVEHLQSAVGLVWRALVLCLMLLALLTVASWVGS